MCMPAWEVWVTAACPGHDGGMNPGGHTSGGADPSGHANDGSRLKERGAGRRSGRRAWLGTNSEGEDHRRLAVEVRLCRLGRPEERTTRCPGAWFAGCRGGTISSSRAQLNEGGVASVAPRARAPVQGAAGRGVEWHGLGDRHGWRCSREESLGSIAASARPSDVVQREPRKGEATLGGNGEKGGGGWDGLSPPVVKDEPPGAAAWKVVRTTGGWEEPAVVGWERNRVDAM